MRPFIPKIPEIDNLLSTAGPHRTIVNFRKKQVIFSQGDPNDAVFLIERGMVRLAAISSQGKEAIFAVRNAGCFFGESCMLEEQPLRSYGAIALTEVRAAKTQGNAFAQNLRLGANAHAFITYLLTVNEGLQADLIHNLLSSSEQRLARALLALAELGAEGKPTFRTELSQQDLANMIGATRQLVNTHLKRFRKLGFVDDRGGMKVPGAMRNVAGNG